MDVLTALSKTSTRESLEKLYDILKSPINPTQPLTDNLATPLLPGVYSGSAALVVPANQKITLCGTGEGQPNLFVIKTAGAIVLGANVVVELTNGARAEDVYWFTDSYVTLGAGAQLRGHVLATSYITLGAGATVSGVVLSHADVTIGASGTVHGHVLSHATVSVGANASLLGRMLARGADATVWSATSDSSRLLLISTNISDHALLVKSAEENGVVALAYDSAVSVQTFLDELAKDARVQPGKFQNIGWIFHGFTEGKLRLFSDLELDEEEIVGSIEFVPSQQTTDLFIGLRALALVSDENPRIDLLACCLALNQPKFAEFAAAIRTSAGVDLAASTDLTGNVTKGGDWILETHDVDAAELYFDLASLQTYSYTFNATFMDKSTKLLNEMADRINTATKDFQELARTVNYEPFIDLSQASKFMEGYNGERVSFKTRLTILSKLPTSNARNIAFYNIWNEIKRAHEDVLATSGIITGLIETGYDANKLRFFSGQSISYSLEVLLEHFEHYSKSARKDSIDQTDLVDVRASMKLNISLRIGDQPYKIKSGIQEIHEYGRKLATDVYDNLDNVNKLHTIVTEKTLQLYNQGGYVHTEDMRILFDNENTRKFKTLSDEIRASTDKHLGNWITKFITNPEVLHSNYVKSKDLLKYITVVLAKVEELVEIDQRIAELDFSSIEQRCVSHRATLRTLLLYYIAYDANPLSRPVAGRAPQALDRLKDAIYEDTKKWSEHLQTVQLRSPMENIEILRKALLDLQGARITQRGTPASPTYDDIQDTFLDGFVTRFMRFREESKVVLDAPKVQIEFNRFKVYIEETMHNINVNVFDRERAINSKIKGFSFKTAAKIRQLLGNYLHAFSVFDATFTKYVLLQRTMHNLATIDRIIDVGEKECARANAALVPADNFGRRYQDLPAFRYAMTGIDWAIAEDLIASQLSPRATLLQNEQYYTFPEDERELKTELILADVLKYPKTQIEEASNTLPGFYLQKEHMGRRTSTYYKNNYFEMFRRSRYYIGGPSAYYEFQSHPGYQLKDKIA